MSTQSTTDLVRQLYGFLSQLPQDPEEVSMLCLEVVHDQIRNFNLCLDGLFESLDHKGDVLVVYPDLELALQAVHEHTVNHIDVVHQGSTVLTVRPGETWTYTCVNGALTVVPS